MNKLLLTLAITGSLVLSGCSSNYQAESFGSGFSSSQLDENVFIVTFKGNAYTSKDKTTDFVLLRSAELALENGYPYFAIVNASSYETMSAYTTSTTSYTIGNTTSTYGGQTYLQSKPTDSNTIIGYKEKPSGFSYSAKYLIKSLKEKHNIK